MKLRHLNQLLAIEDAHSITGAAKQLDVSQVAASKSLAEVERSLGQPLFERGRRGLVPSDLCLRILETAHRISKEIDRLDEEFSMVSEGVKGRVRIGLQTQCTQSFLTKAIFQFKRTYPFITLEFNIASPRELAPDLERGNIHFIIGPLSIAEGPYKFLSEPIVAENALVIAGPDLAVDHCDKTWPQLMDKVWCLPPVGEPLRNLFDRVIASEGLGQPERIVEMPPTFLAEAIIRNSDYLMLVPEAVGIQWAEGADIHILDLRLPHIEEMMGLIWSDGPMTPAGKIFHRFVRHEIEGVDASAEEMTN